MIPTLIPYRLHMIGKFVEARDPGHGPKGAAISFVLHFWARDPDPGPQSHIVSIFQVILFSHYFYIFGARDAGLGPKAVLGQARAGPLPPLGGLDPGPGPSSLKKI